MLMKWGSVHSELKIKATILAVWFHKNSLEYKKILLQRSEGMRSKNIVGAHPCTGSWSGVVNLKPRHARADGSNQKTESTGARHPLRPDQPVEIRGRDIAEPKRFFA
jgi:hypothetical protein